MEKRITYEDLAYHLALAHPWNVKGLYKLEFEAKTWPVYNSIPPQYEAAAKLTIDGEVVVLARAAAVATPDNVKNLACKFLIDQVLFAGVAKCKEMTELTKEKYGTNIKT